MHTCTHTHSSTHPPTPHTPHTHPYVTHSHTYIYSHALTYTHTSYPLRHNTHTLTCPHTHSHAHTHTYTLTCPHSHIHTHFCPWFQGIYRPDTLGSTHLGSATSAVAQILPALREWGPISSAPVTSLFLLPTLTFLSRAMPFHSVWNLGDPIGITIELP